MKRSPSQRHDDAIIRACLLAPATETHAAVGIRLGLPTSTVECYRRREVPRAMLIADELGLPRRATKPRQRYTLHNAAAERRMIARIMEGDE